MHKMFLSNLIEYHSSSMFLCRKSVKGCLQSTAWMQFCNWITNTFNKVFKHLNSSLNSTKGLHNPSLSQTAPICHLCLEPTRDQPLQGCCQHLAPVKRRPRKEGCYSQAALGTITALVDPWGPLHCWRPVKEAKGIALGVNLYWESRSVPNIVTFWILSSYRNSGIVCTTLK